MCQALSQEYLCLENTDAVMYEPHLIPIFDEKFNVRCLFEEEDEDDNDDRPRLLPRPSFDSDSYSIHIFDEDSDDSGAGPSELAAGFSDQDHQSVADAIGASEKPAKQDQTRSTIDKDIGYYVDMGGGVSSHESAGPSTLTVGSSDQDHQSISGAICASEKPAPQEKTRSTINKDVKFYDNMGAEISIQDSEGPSGSTVGSSDQDHQLVSAAISASKKPAKRDKTRSIINRDVKFYDNMGAEKSRLDSEGPSGSTVGSSNQDHQTVPTAICASSIKKIVPQKKNPFQITVEVEVHHNPQMPPKDNIEDAAGSATELAVNEPQDQNELTRIGSDPEMFVLKHEYHIDEQGDIHDNMNPKEATEDAQSSSGLPTESVVNEETFPNGSAKNGSVPEKSVMQDVNNSLREEEGNFHEKMYCKEATTEESAGPLEFAAALNMPRDRNEAVAIQSVVVGLVPEEFELLERHFQIPSMPGEEIISATEEGQVDEDMEDTSSIIETSL